MKISTALKRIQDLDRKNHYVFTIHDLEIAFFEEEGRTFADTIKRLVNAGYLERIARGVYLNPNSRFEGGYLLHKIAATLRRGTYCYVSLESALSQYGVISQIPVQYLTIMTTGRKGKFTTAYGTIEFTHTDKRYEDIINGMVRGPEPLPFASPEMALTDLKRVGRNTHLVNLDDYQEAVSDAQQARL